MGEMIVRCAFDKLVDLDELIAHPKNRNKHPDDQIKRLAEILKYQGWRYPVKVSNRSERVTSGHGRILAAKLAGWKQVPVNYQDYDSDEQEYADVQADNAIASWAELDLSGINSDIGDLGPDFDIDLLGIKDFVLEPAELIPQCDEDAVPEHVEPRTKLGDVYQLGRHRLMCGDSTSIDAVENLMGGEKADMVFTDPPYGMRLDTDYTTMGGSSKKHAPVLGDGDDFTPELINTVFASAPSATEVFMWGADYYAEHLPNKNDGAWLVWDKRSSPEDIGKMDGQFGSAFELCWSMKKHSREMIRLTRPTSFWRGDETSVHPTQKPVGLVEWIFERYGKPNVLDLFGGSGSTLIACEKTNRRCFMMELDPKYCSVIVERWCKYTGQEAYLLNEDGTQTAWSEIRAVGQ